MYMYYGIRRDFYNQNNTQHTESYDHVRMHALGNQRVKIFPIYILCGTDVYGRLRSGHMTHEKGLVPSESFSEDRPHTALRYPTDRLYCLGTTAHRNTAGIPEVLRELIKAPPLCTAVCW